MKVLMLNGSRREHGCTYTAMGIIADALSEQGIDSEIIFAGKEAVGGNVDEFVKSLRKKCKEADGFIFGAPVYYASPTGEIQVVLDRLFSIAGDTMRGKPAGIITSARRAGTTASLEVLSKYPAINEMPIVSSCYWPMVHGVEPGDVLKDEEGVAVMKTLGNNMAWILKCIEAGKAAGISMPDPIVYNPTNFIR